MVGMNFFFNDTATTEIYTLSLHDALPISPGSGQPQLAAPGQPGYGQVMQGFIETSNVNAVQEITSLITAQRAYEIDRKSTRLNSSHANISYAVFCLKKKNNKYDY